MGLFELCVGPMPTGGLLVDLRALLDLLGRLAVRRRLPDDLDPDGPLGAQLDGLEQDLDSLLALLLEGLGLAADVVLALEDAEGRLGLHVDPGLEDQPGRVGLLDLELQLRTLALR